MKVTLTILPFLIYTVKALAQQPDTSSNVCFIYDSKIIHNLRAVIDSVNQQVTKTPTPAYKSVPYAKAHYVRLDTFNIQEARKDMDRGLSYASFIRKYTSAQKLENLLIAKSSCKNYNGKRQACLQPVVIDITGNNGIPSIMLQKDSSTGDKMTHKWYYDYSNGTLKALYVTEEFIQLDLPAKYAGLLQYTDYMVDPSEDIFFEEQQHAQEGEQQSEAIRRYFTYLTQFVGEFIEDSNHYEQSFLTWYYKRKDILDSVFAYNTTAHQILEETVSDVLENGGSNDLFEEDVEHYEAPSTALTLKRSRREPVFSCKEFLPLYQLKDMSRLAAITGQYRLFMKIYVSLINARIPRFTNTYYQEKWQPHLRELEAMHINTQQLLLGISMETSNHKHYTGNTWFNAIVATEVQNTILFETQLQEMIKDPALDDLNRIRLFHLYYSYVQNLTDKAQQRKSYAQLQNIFNTIPDHLTLGVRLNLPADK